MLLGLLLVATYVCESPPLRATNGVAVDSIRQFPRVEGTNLEKRQFSLPRDFESEYNVVIIAFRREQQADVDTWVPFLREHLQRAALDVRVYELPALSRTYRLMRGFIDGGMARGIPDKATRESTITLYIDKERFRRALGIQGENCISTMLVARDGRVLWHATGAFTKPNGDALAQMVANIAPRKKDDPALWDQGLH